MLHKATQCYISHTLSLHFPTIFPPLSPPSSRPPSRLPPLRLVTNPRSRAWISRRRAAFPAACVVARNPPGVNEPKRGRHAPSPFEPHNGPPDERTTPNVPRVPRFSRPRIRVHSCHSWLLLSVFPRTRHNSTNPDTSSPTLRLVPTDRKNCQTNPILAPHTAPSANECRMVHPLLLQRWKFSVGRSTFSLRCSVFDVRCSMFDVRLPSPLPSSLPAFAPSPTML